MGHVGLSPTLLNQSIRLAVVGTYRVACDRPVRLGATGTLEERCAVVGLLGLVMVAGLAAATLVAITPAGAASKPAAPGRPLVAPGKAQVKVTWTAPKSNGSPITGYVVTPFLGAKALPAHTFKTKATSQVIAGLKNAKTYTFRVAAKNKVGLGAPFRRRRPRSCPPRRRR